MAKWKVTANNLPFNPIEGTKPVINDAGHLLIYDGNEIVAFFNATEWVSCVKQKPEQKAQEEARGIIEKAVVDSIKKHSRSRSLV